MVVLYDLVAIRNLVGSCSNKKSKLDDYVTPSSPDKTTVASKLTSNSEKPHHNKNEHSPLLNKKGKVMAVVAMTNYSRAHHHKSSMQATKEKLI